MPDYELIQEMIDAIQDRGTDLNHWEKEFIPSIIGQYKMRGWLSEHQITQIERIYREKTPDGARENRLPSAQTDAQRKNDRVRNEGFEPGRSGSERLRREKGYDE